MVRGEGFCPAGKVEAETLEQAVNETFHLTDFVVEMSPEPHVTVGIYRVSELRDFRPARVVIGPREEEVSFHRTHEDFGLRIPKHTSYISLRNSLEHQMLQRLGIEE